MHVQLAPDGNCFLRSVADQLHGEIGDHTDIREQIVDHMMTAEDDYAPFVEFDESWSSYTLRMRKVCSCCTQLYSHTCSCTIYRERCV